MKKTEEGVRKIVVRLNPQSSALDGVLLAKLDACHVPPTHMLKMLLVNHFAQQPGGLGLADDEQAAFAELSPRFGRKVSAEKMDKKKSAAPPKKQKDAAVEAAPVMGGSDTSDADSGWIPWGPGNPPPCLDMSDFENFGK